MKEGPDIALLGNLIGDPARANMLVALLSGKALTASELANEAGITPQTASSHLGKLETAQLISQRKQGRHKYFSLADEDVSQVLEAMMGLAAKQGHMRTRTGPKDPALRQARVCYNHLAGELSVQAYDKFVKRKYILEQDENIELSTEGFKFFTDFGIDVGNLINPKRSLCKSCLDWSARRTHLAGDLGAALLQKIYDNGWANRIENSRVVSFTRGGEKMFHDTFIKL